MYTLDPNFSPQEWDSYLDLDRRATVYHTLQWRSILEDVFHYETFYAVCRNISGAPVGVLPIAFVKSWITGRRVVSLPLSQYGGPLTSDVGGFLCIVNHLKEYLGRGFEYVRLRTREPFEQNLVASSGLESAEYFSRCVVPLAGRRESDVWQSLHRNSVRRSIEASLRHGITVGMLDSANEIDRVNELMLQTCKKHGVPPYSPRLLEAIKNMLIPKKLARIFVARLAGKMVAAVVLFIMNNDSIYAYNFSDSNYLRFRPNNALIWAAIKWSLDNALSNLDLGISSPQDNELLSFKMRWGATRTRVRDYFLVRGGMAIPADRRASLRYRLAAAAWRTLLPSFLARKMGPMLLTHLE